MNGQLANTSTAEINISLTIPAQIEVKQQNDKPVAESVNTDVQYETVKQYELSSGVVVYVIEPK